MGTICTGKRSKGVPREHNFLDTLYRKTYWRVRENRTDLFQSTDKIFRGSKEGRTTAEKSNTGRLGEGWRLTEAEKGLGKGC